VATILMIFPKINWSSNGIAGWWNENFRWWNARYRMWWSLNWFWGPHRCFEAGGSLRRLW